MSNQIKPPPYLKGKKFIQRVMEVLEKKSLAEISNTLSINRATLNTWINHERTSHEVMLRLHKAVNIPLDAFLEGSESTFSVNVDYNIPPFKRLSGGLFVDKLKKVLNCQDLKCLSETLLVPQPTFSTWKTHDRTSDELIVRLILNGCATANDFLGEADDKTNKQEAPKPEVPIDLFEQLDSTNPITAELREFMTDRKIKIEMINGKAKIARVEN